MSAYVVFSALRAGQLKMDEQVLIAARLASGRFAHLRSGHARPVDVLIRV
jgi:D-alanyl-D-alanine carboxypeptidase